MKPPQGWQPELIMICPHWGDEAHFSYFRSQRFLRWLGELGSSALVVRRGPEAGFTAMDWGGVWTVPDPLQRGAAGRVVPAAKPVPSLPSRLSLRQHLSNFAFPADRLGPWAWRVGASPGVRGLARQARWIISTGPPHSVHVAARLLHMGSTARLLVDLRDGWLDETLFPLVQRYRLNQWREGLRERWVLRAADAVLVTSPLWQQMLDERLPWCREKSALLYNSYPFKTAPVRSSQPAGKPLRLLYAGRFSGSNMRRNPGQLLAVLLAALETQPLPAVQLDIFGALSGPELGMLERWRPRFASHAWQISLHQPLPRAALATQLASADGLLMLSASYPGMPLKFYDYLPSRRPVLAVCERDGAVWRLDAELPQLFTVDLAAPPADAARQVVAFLAASAQAQPPIVLPERFGDAAQKTAFLQLLDRLED